MIWKGYLLTLVFVGKSSYAVDAFSTVATRSAALRVQASTLETTETSVNQRTSEDRQQIENTERPLPGHDENELFHCEPSVAFWRDFQRNGPEPADANVQGIVKVVSEFSGMGPAAISYFLKHAGRSVYFIVNALLGNVGFLIHERLVKGNREVALMQALPIQLTDVVATRLLLETFLCYQQDFAEIKAGVYREPWDMDPTHRQSSPINVVSQTGKFIDEAIGTLGRRQRQSQADKDIWITNSAAPDIYPEYYRTAFHYQTDGWMSKKSADVYETSTETLFLGRQDAMQRLSLKPIIQLSERPKRDGQPLKILEVACGTGRFMTFIRDNLPLDTEYTAVDLSPFYLDAARENDKYWRRTRKASESNSVEIAPANIIQAQAEDLPFESNSFDAVVCVYLFHELPREVRAKAAAEMARVVAPGGTVVLTDSVQRGDRPIVDKGLKNFGNFNEPYYTDYTEDFLPKHFQSAGLTPLSKALRSSTKSLSFAKMEDNQ